MGEDMKERRELTSSNDDSESHRFDRNFNLTTRSIRPDGADAEAAAAGGAREQMEVKSAAK